LSWRWSRLPSGAAQWCATARWSGWKAGRRRGGGAAAKRRHHRRGEGRAGHGPVERAGLCLAGRAGPIYPVRGQILELRVPDPQLKASLSYGHAYLVCKADGLTLAGRPRSTRAGSTTTTTAGGLETIMEGTLRLCAFPGAGPTDQPRGRLAPRLSDGYPFVGPVPGREGVYMCAGHFRRGMVLSLVSARIIADLVATGQCSLPSPK